MRKVEFVPFLLTEVTDIFSIRIDNDKFTEVNKFFIMFKDTGDPFLKDDMNKIVNGLSQIANNGALERFFRYEGTMSDRVVAIPLYIIPRDHSQHGTLRLYCIRVSDKLLIVGGGGLLGEIGGAVDLNDTFFNLTVEID